MTTGRCRGRSPNNLEVTEPTRQPISNVSRIERTFRSVEGMSALHIHLARTNRVNEHGIELLGRKCHGCKNLPEKIKVHCQNPQWVPLCLPRPQARYSEPAGSPPSTLVLTTPVVRTRHRVMAQGLSAKTHRTYRATAYLTKRIHSQI